MIYCNLKILFLFQSTRFFIHVVSESTQIYKVHHLAQLQVDYFKTDHNFRISNNYFTILLFYTRLCCEKNDGCLDISNLYFIVAKNLHSKCICHKICLLIPHLYFAFHKLFLIKKPIV